MCRFPVEGVHFVHDWSTGEALLDRVARSRAMPGRFIVDLRARRIVDTCHLPMVIYRRCSSSGVWTAGRRREGALQVETSGSNHPLGVARSPPLLSFESRRC